MASAMATWTPSSLQLRIALNCRSFKAAPARAKLTKLSPRLRTSCAAHNAESGRGSDLFRGWADSGDDETSPYSGGGNWYKGANFFCSEFVGKRDWSQRFCLIECKMKIKVLPFIDFQEHWSLEWLGWFSSLG